METYKYIINKAIPTFLKSYKYDYVVVGGKAYQYYFKSITTDDWDIIIDGNPMKFIESLKSYLVEKHNILLADLYQSKSILNNDSLYQLGYKPYKNENLFIDIKVDNITPYKSIIINGIKCASLSYLYKDGLETLSDRKKNYKQQKLMITDEKNIEKQITYLKYTIKLNIPNYFKFIQSFYKKNLKKFKESIMITSLREYLTDFLEYYKDNSLSKSISVKLEEAYELLIEEHLYKYTDIVSTTNEKKRLLYELIQTMDKFYKDKKLYKNSRDEISKNREFIREQRKISDIIKTKYLKSYKRNEIFIEMIKNPSISIFSDIFKQYIKDNCINNKYIIKLGSDRININCSNRKRRNSTGSLRTTYLGIKKHK
jgi:hypothetical protein